MKNNTPLDIFKYQSGTMLKVLELNKENLVKPLKVKGDLQQDNLNKEFFPF